MLRTTAHIPVIIWSGHVLRDNLVPAEEGRDVVTSHRCGAPGEEKKVCPECLYYMRYYFITS